VNDDDLQISDPVEIAEVDRFGSDPEFLQHDGVQWPMELTFAPPQPFRVPHGRVTWRDRGERRIEEERRSPTRACRVSLLLQGVAFI
jgi:hypothetical protein